ncbi:response regulator [Winogradskyella schleiferi]|uniref:response regulator n=1 Tax=Winogradskyella schleiferi TaxID=2686078 RepID=UPI0015BCC459|nr:response regulator [Winogradskyella schleiferi]
MKLLEESSIELDTTIQIQKIKKALNESKKIKFHYGIYTSYKKIAVLKKAIYNSDSAISEYKNLIKLLPESNQYSHYALQLIGDEFSKRSLFDSSIYYHNKLIKLGKDYSNNLTICNAYISIGNIWNQTYDYDKAFMSYSKADSVCENDLKLKVSTKRAVINNYMGFCIRKSNGDKDAIEYYFKAKNIHEKLKNNEGVQEVNIAIAQAYTSFEEYDKALKLLNESILFHQNYAPHRNSYSYGVIVRGYLLLQMKNYVKAEKDYLLYYDLALKSKNEFYQRSGLGYLGLFYKSSGQLQKAEKYYKLAIEKNQLANDNGRVSQNIEELITVLKRKKDYKEAVTYYELLLDIQKQSDTKKIAQETRNLEAKYQTEKKEQEINLLKSQKEIVEQQKTNQQNILLGGMAITTIAGLFLFFLYRNRQRTNTKLKELDVLKSSFFTNISHEFRTPLALITSPINELLSEDSISDKKRQQFTVAKQNSERLLELVNQLLDLSKIDEGHLKLKLQEGKVLQLISALSEAFNYYAEQKNITYTIHIAKGEKTVWFDKSVVEKITVNLLSNAIKYTPENGTISCKALIENNKLFFSITNSGKGLTSYELSNIFERFYQSNEQNQGSGIGLSLVKELVGLHHGKIEVQSILNKETTFELHIAVDKKSFKNEVFIATSLNDIENSILLYPNTTIEEEETFTTNDLPIVLIVEDNDDLRNLLKLAFEDHYNIITASNGTIGVELALEHIPDLIISDVMMPEKNGIALTEDLKTDERTAHIPIILLTAKAGVESQFKGIEFGADDYITKPFDTKLLILKVEKLIESRRQLQLRYSQELVLIPRDIAITNLDEKFLKKVETILEKNLINPSFNVSEFSEAVGMSRMQLHRKLKALTGLTASEFVRSQRLKLAAQLLKSSNINISGIGYSVGFNDHSYFTKCFKEAYNCTPTEFAKRN